jgi:hypothetical protein
LKYNWHVDPVKQVNNVKPPEELVWADVARAGARVSNRTATTVNASGGYRLWPRKVTTLGMLDVLLKASVAEVKLYMFMTLYEETV